MTSRNALKTETACCHLIFSTSKKSFCFCTDIVLNLDVNPPVPLSSNYLHFPYWNLKWSTCSSERENELNCREKTLDLTAVIPGRRGMERISSETQQSEIQTIWKGTTVKIVLFNIFHMHYLSKFWNRFKVKLDKHENVFVWPSNILLVQPIVGVSVCEEGRERPKPQKEERGHQHLLHLQFLAW